MVFVPKQKKKQHRQQEAEVQHEQDGKRFVVFGLVHKS
jgi:hypothetical protein